MKRLKLYCSLVSLGLERPDMSILSIMTMMNFTLPPSAMGLPGTMSMMDTMRYYSMTSREVHAICNWSHCYDSWTDTLSWSLSKEPTLGSVLESSTSLQTSSLRIGTSGKIEESNTLPWRGVSPRCSSSTPSFMRRILDMSNKITIGGSRTPLKRQ